MDEENKEYKTAAKNNDIVDFDEIFNGLKLISDYLDKSILRPNNISHPKSRIDFLNIIKE